MPNLISISSLDDPRLADYANLRDAELRHRQDPANPVLASPGRFMAEGELVVRRLIAAAPRFLTRSVLTTTTRLETIGDALSPLPGSTPVYLVDQPTMNQVVGFNMHRGILAVGSPAPPSPGSPIDDLVRSCRLLLVLEDLVNHDNIGGIFRSAAALGGHGTGILLSPRCADPLYRKSLRVSMGNVLTVPYTRIQQWPADLEALRKAGWTLVALSPDAAGVEIGAYAAALSSHAEVPRLALVLGTEGPGLSPAALPYMDTHVRIAIDPTVDSLNVGVAAAIALHRLAQPGPRNKPDLPDV